MDEDTQTSHNASLFITEVDGDAIINYQISSYPAIGTLTMDGLFNITYTPIPDFNGIVYFELTGTDANGNSNTVIVAIDVAQVNDAPIA